VGGGAGAVLKEGVNTLSVGLYANGHGHVSGKQTRLLAPPAVVTFSVPSAAPLPQGMAGWGGRRGKPGGSGRSRGGGERRG